MMAKILNPLVFALLGIALSVGIGVGVTWRTLNAMVTKAVLLKAQAAPNELKKKGWDFWTIEAENLSSELRDERERLKQESEKLDQREATIVAAEKELAKARADLDAMQKQISDRVVEISNDELINLKKLAQTFSNVTPRAAVAIIREMDDSAAVKVLSLLKPDVIGPIFEEMSKGSDGTAPLARRAATLSDKLRLVKNTRSTAAP
jgi:flagellar motility protein MotE (MotC chaperone)